MSYYSIVSVKAVGTSHTKFNDIHVPQFTLWCIYNYAAVALQVLHLQGYSLNCEAPHIVNIINLGVTLLNMYFRHYTYCSRTLSLSLYYIYIILVVAIIRLTSLELAS